MSKGIWLKTKEKLNNLHKSWEISDSALMSTEQISKQIKLDWHTTDKYLRKLEKMGLVKSIEIKTNKKKVTYWEKKKKLKDKSTDSV